MFDLNGVFSALICIGVLLGLLFLGIPAYFIGKHYGRQEVYNEAIQHKVLDIRYDPNSGDKLVIWKNKGD